MIISRTGQKKGPYKPKVLKFNHTCEECSTDFKSADVKGRFCLKCKSSKACKCGCDKMVKTPGRYYANASCRNKKLI